MPVPRNKQITTNVEFTLFDRIGRIAVEEDVSVSAYIRELILRDLVRRGSMTREMAEAML